MDDAAPDVLRSGPGDGARRRAGRVPRLWRLLALVLVVAGGAAVVGPELLSGSTSVGDGRRDRPTMARHNEAAAADRRVGGDLAGDDTFVSAVLRFVRADHPEADRVLFAGTVPGGGRVAYVGRDRDEPEGIWAMDVYALRLLPGAQPAEGEITLVGRGLIESAGLLGAHQGHGEP